MTAEVDSRHVAPGDQLGPRRHAPGSGHERGQTNPFLREAIQVGCPDQRMTVAREIAVPEVISKEDNEIGLSFLGPKG